MNEKPPEDEILVLNLREFATRIGMLRQWLNEDRITDNKRMVTSEMIKTWLLPKLVDGIKKTS